jgi:hypothetical protein
VAFLAAVCAIMAVGADKHMLALIVEDDLVEIGVVRAA